MIFRQLFDRESSTYTYLIGDTKSCEALLIDPVIDNTQQYLALAQQLGLNITTAADTHTHADHITALGELRDAISCTTMMGKQAKADCVSRSFNDGEKFNIGKLRIEAIHTPGHTDDSYSFYLAEPSPGKLFTGDTLLIRGTGRTDFQNGDAHQQYHSLFHKLLQLPDDTLVYPGHDYHGMTVSTIKEEKSFNPRLQVTTERAYVELMDSLNLPNPKLMDVAVPANQSCGQRII